MSGMSIAPPSKLQYSAFQVLWSSKTCEDLRPSLQIRAFTSHSYKHLKEREGKKERRQHGKTQAWHASQSRSDRTEHTSGKGNEPSHAGFESDDGVIDLAVDDLPSPHEEDSTPWKGARDLQVPSSPRREECKTQSVDASSRPTAVSIISPSRPLVATSSGQPTDLGYNYDTIVEPDRDHNISFRHAQDEAMNHEYGVFTRSLEHELAPTEHPAEPKSPLPQSPQPGGIATSSDLKPSECQIDGDCSLHRATHWAPEEARQTNTISGSVVPTSAELVWNEAGQKSSRRGRRMGPMSPITWTEDADARLLHLHDVAQLDWRTLVSYFPGARPHGIRERYQQLKESATADQATDNQHPSQSCGRTAIHPLSDSHFWTAKVPDATAHTAQSATPTSRAVFAPRSIARRRRPDGAVEPAMPSMPSVRSTQHRTSRCGQTIRHPFRNRPSEGYI